MKVTAHQNQITLRAVSPTTDRTGDQINARRFNRRKQRQENCAAGLVEPPTAEVSFEDSGNMLGVATTGLGTYTSVVSPDGSIYGEGQGLATTADGEGITWKGSGQ